jgi:type II secretory pathway pseudopilin PulG
MSTQSQRGFTVLELIIVVVFLIIAGTVVFVQKRDLEVATRDSTRKSAINSMYYNLEDVYYAANKSYPQHITADTLKGIDPTILKDPNGITIGEEGSDYRYEPRDCNENICKGYELRADLEHEADLTKTSRNQ